MPPAATSRSLATPSAGFAVMPDQRVGAAALEAEHELPTAPSAPAPAPPPAPPDGAIARAGLDRRPDAHARAPRARGSRSPGRPPRPRRRASGRRRSRRRRAPRRRSGWATKPVSVRRTRAASPSGSGRSAWCTTATAPSTADAMPRRSRPTARTGITRTWLRTPQRPSARRIAGQRRSHRPHEPAQEEVALPARARRPSSGPSNSRRTCCQTVSATASGSPAPSTSKSSPRAA